MAPHQIILSILLVWGIPAFFIFIYCVNEASLHKLTDVFSYTVFWPLWFVAFVLKATVYTAIKLFKFVFSGFE